MIPTRVSCRETSNTPALVFAINERGTVVGTGDIFDSELNLIVEYGFTWENGNFTDVNVPGSVGTSIVGINAPGDLVGHWDSKPTLTIKHGFVFSKKKFTTYDVPFPGVLGTQGNDVNAKGDIVGSYFSDPTYGIPGGFLKVGTTFTDIAYPGAVATSAWGINSAGQMVGIWYDSDYNGHGWLAQPGHKGKPAAGIHVSMHSRPPADLQLRLPVTLK